MGVTCVAICGCGAGFCGWACCFGIGGVVEGCGVFGALTWGELRMSGACFLPSISGMIEFWSCATLAWLSIGCRWPTQPTV